MADCGWTDNGVNWIDGHIKYKVLNTFINETMAGFAYLYAYGVTKCMFHPGLTGRPIYVLEDVNCPSPDSLKNDRPWCILLCHKFPKFACANKTARSLYDWLMYYLQKKGIWVKKLMCVCVCELHLLFSLHF